MDETIPEMSIALLVDYRGIGLGTWMIQEIIRMACERVPYISLSVVETILARRLYERLGFQIVGREGNSPSHVIIVEGQ